MEKVLNRLALYPSLYPTRRLSSKKKILQEIILQYNIMCKQRKIQKTKVMNKLLQQQSNSGCCRVNIGYLFSLRFFLVIKVITIGLICFYSVETNAWKIPITPMLSISRTKLLLSASFRSLLSKQTQQHYSTILLKPAHQEQCIRSSPYYKNNNVFCFGTKAGIPGNPPGTIAIYNEQDEIKTIDENALRETISRIAKLIGYETYDVTLMLVEDEEMRETNLESRNIDAPTDILSFPFHDYIEPGKLVEPEFDIPDYYNLGDMVVDVPYVMRRCQEDKEDSERQDCGDDDEEEERGVSGAMATVYDTEKRIHMLLVHGMLHLVGYDHEDDDEYELMVSKEEEILGRLGFSSFQ